MKEKEKIISEICKYKKKSKAKGIKRANHKHQYVEALFEYPNKYSSINKTTCNRIEYCSICGRVNVGFCLETEPIPGKPFCRYLSDDEIKDKYKHLPMYKLDYHPIKFVHIEQLGE